jgi:pimeloyl-ACP methyl ester carboxylesterase
MPEAVTIKEGLPPNIYKTCLIYNKREIYCSIPQDVPIDTEVVINFNDTYLLKLIIFILRIIYKVFHIYHSSFFFEVLKTSREVFSRPLRIECPLFISIGTEDVLVHPKLLINYFTKVEKNAQLKIIEHGYHELHNEIEKYRKPYLNFLRHSLTGLTFDE